jgi:PAS domain S-box-containing protein
MWGYDREAEAIGSDLVFSHQKKIQRKIYSALGRHNSWSGEIESRRRDGSAFYVQLTASRVDDESRNPVCIMASFMDVTDRKGLEQHLEYRVKELSCLYAISRIAERPGVSLEELCLEMAKLLRYSLRFPDAVYVAIKVFDDRFDTDNCQDSRWKQSVDVRVYGNSIGYVETGYTEEADWGDEGPFLREEGMLLDAVADWLGRHIESLRNETARCESEEKYRALVNVSPYGIVLSDKAGIITFCNPTYHQILGYEEGEIVGRHLWDFSRNEDDGKYLENHYKYLMLLQPVSSPYTGMSRTRDGRIIDTRVDWSYLRDTAGNLTGICSVISDITAKKRGEDALRNSEERLSTFLNAATDLFYQFDDGLRLIEVNETALKYSKCSRKEAINREIGEILPDIADDNCYRIYRDIIQNDKPHFSEVEVKFPQTGKRELARKAFKVGQGLGIILTDITEWRRADEEARMFKNIADTANHGVSITDYDGKIIYINSYFASMHGYHSAELIGQPMTVLHNRSQMAEAIRLYHNELRTRPSFNTREIWHAHRDGPVFPMLMNGSVITDAKGKQQFMAFTAMDITEHKAAAEESSFKAQILDAATDSIYVQDLKGHLIYVNETAHRSRGYEHDEMLGKIVTELEVDPGAVVYRDRVKKLRNEQDISWETNHLQKDGSVFPVEVNARRVKLAGDDYILSIVRDVTERKQWEERLQDKKRRLDDQNEELISQREELIAHRLDLMEKTKQLEEASEAKSAFLASMSHELRTPLNAIIGFSELMMDSVIGRVNREQRQCLSDILSSGEHLLALINDVLDLSKIEAGRVDIKLEGLDAGRVIEHTVKTIKPMIDGNQHQMKLDIAPGIPKINADYFRLKQVLLNLLSNAIKFTPPGGNIGVKVWRDGDFCAISVSDTGVGIRESDKERMFDAFTQGDTLPDKQKEGTGLGLGLSRRFVEMMGGVISVESTYGEGSVFTFTIPFVTGKKEN